MKRLITPLLLLVSTFVIAQNLDGAWKWEGKNEAGKDIMAVAIIQNEYFSVTWYDLDGKEFISTNGGTWSMNGDMMVQSFEFNTSDASQVGSTQEFQVQISDDKVVLPDSGDEWSRIDANSPGALAGAWLITGRKRNGEISERDPNRPRKTMKILSGSRFQWIAYNTETGEFFGTGGGSYTTEDGKYTENIEFFSRDGSRVGASLEFDFKVETDGAWHHSGLSSKGDPIYEIWRQRTM